MSWEATALFAHIVAAVAGFSIAAVLHAGLILSHSSTSLAEFRPWPRVIRRLEPLLGLSTLAVFGTGVWLIMLHGEWVSWTDGWVLASIVALAAVPLMNFVAKPREGAMLSAIESAPVGNPVTDEMRPDPVVFLVAHLSTALVLGILFLMVFKPSGVGSVAALGVAVALGALSTIPFRRPRVVSSDVSHAATT